MDRGRMSHLIHPGGGLIRPGGGLLRAPASSAAEVIPQTLDGIANASDPLQAFADACGLSFQVDYLWIGNELVGATELGGSGLDLVNSGTVDQGQADARLGAGNTCLFNTFDENMSVASALLNIGTASAAIFQIDASNSTGADRYHVAKWGGTTPGYIGGQGPTDDRDFYVKTASGTFYTKIAGPHGTTDAIVVLRLRNETTATNSIISANGTGTVAETAASGRDADNAVAFEVGSGSAAGQNRNWGLTAIKKGSGAESITATHRSNLQTWLGF